MSRGSWMSGDQRHQFGVKVGAAGQYGAPTTPTHGGVYGDETPSYQPHQQQSSTLPRAAPHHQHDPEPQFQPAYQSPSYYQEQRRMRQQGGPRPLRQLYDVNREKEHERNAIIAQPFRTRQLITPTVKTTWDLPTGSYLRNWGRSAHQPEVVNRETYYQETPHQSAAPSRHHGSQNAYTTHTGPQYAGSHDDDKQMADSLRRSLSTAANQQSSWASRPTPSGYGGSESSTWHTSTQYHQPQASPAVYQDDSKKVVHAQYNSPMNLYSADNVAETMHSQTGVTPGGYSAQNQSYSSSSYSRSYKSSSSHDYSSSTARAVMDDERYGGRGRHGGALQVNEDEPYQTRSVRELHNMFSGRGN